MPSSPYPEDKACHRPMRNRLGAFPQRRVASPRADRDPVRRRTELLAARQVHAGAALVRSAHRAGAADPALLRQPPQVHVARGSAPADGRVDADRHRQRRQHHLAGALDPTPVVQFEERQRARTDYSSVSIWATNVIVFALWYWELDRGGPDARTQADHEEPDFLFPQMVTPQSAPRGWTPAFLDYLYVAFTNATASDADGRCRSPSPRENADALPSHGFAGHDRDRRFSRDRRP